MMSKTNKITVENREISLITTNQNDFISLTDIAKYRNQSDPFAVINNWMRGRTTVAFLGLREALNNVDFKPLEFERFKNEAGYNYFVLSPQRWIEKTNADGNIRDHATLEQLVVLSNMESINSVLIHQGLTQKERIVQLNQTAIIQLKSLLGNKQLKKLQNQSDGLIGADPSILDTNKIP